MVNVNEPEGGDPKTLPEFVLVRLSTGVERLAREVRQLRREIDERPTKDAVAQRRRRGLAFSAVAGLLLIWGHDVHVEHCSPGAQANAVMQWVAERPVNDQGFNQAQFRRVVESTQPTAACDVSFPVQRHGVNSPAAFDVAGVVLSKWNLVGFLFYGFLGGMLFLWQRGPRRRTH